MTCDDHYDKKVTIQKSQGTVDAHGHIDLTANSNWITHTTAFCSVISKGGREFWKVQQVNADVSHVWKTQWSKTVAEALPTMRLVHEDLTYEIMSVVDVDLAHQQIEIQTKRAV